MNDTRSDFDTLRAKALSGQAQPDEMERLAIELILLTIDLMEAAPETATTLHDGLKILIIYTGNQKAAPSDRL